MLEADRLATRGTVAVTTSAGDRPAVVATPANRAETPAIARMPLSLAECDDRPFVGQYVDLMTGLQDSFLPRQGAISYFE